MWHGGMISSQIVETNNAVATRMEPFCWNKQKQRRFLSCFDSTYALYIGDACFLGFLLNQNILYSWHLLNQKNKICHMESPQIPIPLPSRRRFLFGNPCESPWNWGKIFTLLGTNISPPKVCLKMSFLKVGFCIRSLEGRSLPVLPGGHEMLACQQQPRCCGSLHLLSWGAAQKSESNGMSIYPNNYGWSTNPPLMYKTQK